jgi:hypothetical protein
MLRMMFHTEGESVKMAQLFCVLGENLLAEVELDGCHQWMEPGLLQRLEVHLRMD